MDSEEFAEYRAEDVGPDTPYHETLVCDDDRTWFGCNRCGRDVTDTPCPDHAPLDVPGLVRAQCEAEPPHGPFFVLASDRYDPPCPTCQYTALRDQLDETKRCRHWPWRRWLVTGRAAGLAYRLGLISAYGVNLGVNGCDGCQVGFRLRGRRPYLVGIELEGWRCLARGHRRAHVGAGICGRCSPWPCCGSTVEDHAPDCAEDPNRPAVLPPLDLPERVDVALDTQQILPAPARTVAPGIAVTAKVTARGADLVVFPGLYLLTHVASGWSVGPEMCAEHVQRAARAAVDSGIDWAAGKAAVLADERAKALKMEILSLACCARCDATPSPIVVEAVTA